MYLVPDCQTYKILDQVGDKHNVFYKHTYVYTIYNTCAINVGLPVKGTFANVMVDIGHCSGNCRDTCLPTKTRREIFHLYSGPKEVEIIDSCECFLTDSPSCTTVKKQVTYFQGTTCQSTVNVNQCTGSCGGRYLICSYLSMYIYICMCFSLNS